jgi:rhomboid-like protein
VFQHRHRPRKAVLRRHQRRIPSSGDVQPRPSLTFTEINNIVFRPALFTGGVCFISFGAAGIWRYEQQLHREKPNQQELWVMPSFLREPLSKVVISLIEGIANDSRATTVGPIIAANAAVFGAFSLATLMKSTQVTSFLSHFFVHQSSSGQALPLLLSCFTHMGPIHLACNMYVLWNFGDHAVRIFGGREQFWAAYLSAGTISSLGTICLDLAMNRLRGLPFTAGVGASGALMGVIVAFALEQPDARMRIIFLPWWDFSASDLVSGMITLDVVGLLLRWSPIGHAAHLGGAAAGFWAIGMNGMKTAIPAYQDFVVEGYKKLKVMCLTGKSETG